MFICFLLILSCLVSSFAHILLHIGYEFDFFLCFRYVGNFMDSREQFRVNGRIDVLDESCSDPMKLQVPYLCNVAGTHC